ncbi:MAG: XisI protein [Chloroflexi bacterium]|nr:XisI protein [Chloroflexota bacterium]
MDTLDAYREVIEQVLTEYARVPYAHGDIQTETVFDRVNDHYLLVNVGWFGDRRIHGDIVHVDIIEDKVWIQYDGTEDGIANELVRAGIPKERIVLGFHEPEVRQYTDFAVA